MQDNFNIHAWKLKQALNELENRQCPDCGCKMEGTMCNECGYMEEGKSTSTNDLVVRWTKKYIDTEKENPYFYTEKGLADGFEVIGGQKVKEIIGYDEDDNDEIIGHIYSKTKKDIENKYSEEDLDNAFTNALANMKEGATFTDKHDDNPELKGGQKKLPDELQAKILNKEAATPLADLYDLVSELVKQGISKDEILRIVNFATASSVNEGEDHEVFMAQNSLKAIISSASQLMSKVGDDERDIPGWIQDHITNAENYIEQANQGFHELDNEYEEN